MSALAPGNDGNPGNWGLEQTRLWDEATAAFKSAEVTRTLWLTTGMIALVGGLCSGGRAKGLVYVVDHAMPPAGRRINIHYNTPSGRPVDVPLLNGGFRFGESSPARQRFVFCTNLRSILSATTFTPEGSEEAREQVLKASRERDGVISLWNH